MDGVYRHQRHIYDLTRKYYLLGRDRMLAGLDVPPGGTVLELGCGTGRNIVLAARRYPAARFFGLDISAAMLETAQAAWRARRSPAETKLAQGDATDFDALALFGRQRFDRVFISYALSMIPGWEKTDRACAAIAGAGRLAAHRRFRPAGTAAGLVSRHAARLARQVPCLAARRSPRGTANAGPDRQA